MSAQYDYDVVVIGAGPAGLAAATRIRWVKGYHALASSVCLVESGVPGGLLRWGSCVLTGPSWAYSGSALTDILMKDVEDLNIPILSDEVLRIEREGSLLKTFLRSGQVLSSLAVVLATGFRPLANESDYYLKGVRITFKGYEHFPNLIRACAKDAKGRGLVVIGNSKSTHLQTLLDTHSEGSGGVELIDRAVLRKVLGEGRVDAIEVEEDGSIRKIDCGAVLMDYNGFELKPSFEIDGLNLERDARGFIWADGHMATSEPGVFVAGDLTGRYAATLMALGDGVCAGLSSYAYAFEKKFGHPPNLFAYAARDTALPAEPIDLPEIPDTAIPVSLGKDHDWVTNDKSLSEYAEIQEQDIELVRAAIQKGIASKTMTVHHMHTTHDKP